MTSRQPPLPGNPLDPPLRSRFQGARIAPAADAAMHAVLARACPGLEPTHVRHRWMNELCHNCQRPTALCLRVEEALAGWLESQPLPRQVDGLVEFRRALRQLGASRLAVADMSAASAGPGGAAAVGSSSSAMPAASLQQLMYMSDAGLLSAAKLMEALPALPLGDVIMRVYPPAAGFCVRDYELKRELATLYDASTADAGTGGYALERVLRADPQPAGAMMQASRVALSFVPTGETTAMASRSGGAVELGGAGGTTPPIMPAPVGAAGSTTQVCTLTHTGRRNRGLVGRAQNTWRTPRACDERPARQLIPPNAFFSR
jgi:hypothetical protein